MAYKIAVMGMGYVGLVNAVGLADFGHHVIGADIDDKKISQLKAGNIPIYEPGLDGYLHRNVRTGRLKFTDNIEESINWGEVIFITVGTPSTDDGDVDLSQIEGIVTTIANNLNNYKVIVIKSTVPVGTTRKIKEFLIKRVEHSQFDVVMNPEFLREGKALYDFFHPDRVVVGIENDSSIEIMKEIYRPLYLIETPFVFCNYETAELIKYASNAFLATKISFINQVANLCEAVGADIHIVAKAMGMDGRIGSKFLHPGPGFGGSCLPKDTRALVKIGDKYAVNMSLIKEVIKINEQQRLVVVNKIKRLLHTLKDKTIAILGVAFKAETDDIRESSAITIIKQLLKEGATIKVTDPEALHNARRIFGNSVKYCENEYEAIKNADAMVILTEWNAYRDIDLTIAKKYMRGNVIVDARNVLNPKVAKNLGFIYEGMGRR